MITKARDDLKEALDAFMANGTDENSERVQRTLEAFRRATGQGTLTAIREATTTKGDPR